MRALLSVSDKTGLVPLPRRSHAAGCELVSTGGTAKALVGRRPAGHRHFGRHGFSRDDGRPRQDAPSAACTRGILARRHRPDDLACSPSMALRRSTWSSSISIRSPKAAAKPDLPFDELVEEIDIGGPSLAPRGRQEFPRRARRRRSGRLRSRGRRARRGRRPVARAPLRSGAHAFAHTAAYDQIIAATLADVRLDEATGDVRARDAIGADDLAGGLAAATHEDPRPAVRRESASGRPRGTPSVSAGFRRRRRCIKARNCRSPICSTSTRPRGSRSNSTSRPRWSSSTRIPCGAATGGDDRRGVRARARGRSAVGVWRDRRSQSADRRRDRAGARRPRSSRPSWRPVSTERRSAGDPGAAKSESSRGHDDVRGAGDGARRALDHGRVARAGAGPCDRGDPAVARQGVADRRHAAGADGRRMAGASVRVARRARTSSRTRSSSPGPM